jgi:tetratricopeptide (TPR) repeat protein
LRIAPGEAWQNSPGDDRKAPAALGGQSGGRCIRLRAPSLATFHLASLALVALALLWPCRGSAGSPTAPSLESTAATQQFEAANRLYEEKRFPEAVAAYEAILASGRASTALYFNLGNARFKANRIGEAIAAYRQAARSTPRDPDVRANLQFARNQVQGPTLRPGRWQKGFGTLSLNEWTGLGVAGVWLTFGLLTLAQLRPALQPSLRASTWAAGGATLLLLAGLALAWAANRPGDVVVVIRKEVAVRNGPLEESQSAFTVHDGAELRVTDRKDDWLQVSDGTRRLGWLQRGDVATGP